MDVKKYRAETSEQLLKKRVILVDGELNDETIVFIHTALLDLDNKSHKMIDLFFRSGGGLAQPALIIHDTLRSLRSSTRAIIAEAGSAAVLIALGCRERVMLRSGRILIHNPMLTLKGYKFNDSFNDRIKSARKFMKFLKQRSDEIYLERYRSALSAWPRNQLDSRKGM